MTSPVPSKPAGRRMKLRYAGRCGRCQIAQPAGTLAVYDKTARRVICLQCDSDSNAPASVGPATPLPDEPDVAVGTAGASALREHQRRQAAREKRIRRAHPHLGGLILAVTDDPQSTRAWQSGAVGEQRLGHRLDALAGDGVLVLHDRRIPGSRANIDHFAVAPGGVFVLDAKHYPGKRPERQVQGGLFRPRVERLIVGGRDRTTLLDGMGKQVDLARAALVRGGMGDVVVRGMLCFTDGNWPLIGGSFRIRGFDVLWPLLAARTVCAAGPLDAAQIKSAHRLLAASFPPA